MNPATGGLLSEIASDGGKSRTRQVRASTRRATRVGGIERAQAARHDPQVSRARHCDAGHAGAHAHRRSGQADTPVAQRAQRLAGRLDFFIAESARALRDETVLTDPQQKLEERISHEPLASLPTSPRGIIRTSSAATSSFRRSSPATRCSTSRRSTRR